MRKVWHHCKWHWKRHRPSRQHLRGPVEWQTSSFVH
ncbi:hypothetical protein E2C01_079873 [Portunus trituberculatus]|uniref:Uncharacterized protein n=1 Tax=Portunus trituberculatus TaxID=210409 RepID=A0A5B7IY36_PORTR|nr:hypothetical protein [Portunus trituberculatus]